MNELRDWLKDADPIVNEPPLSDADAQRDAAGSRAAGDVGASTSCGRADSGGGTVVCSAHDPWASAVAECRTSKMERQVRSRRVDPGRVSTRRQVQIDCARWDARHLDLQR
jgi:hypothetical protein